MGREQKAESRKNTQEIREKLKAPKCRPECPKTSPREPKTAENRPKGAPRRPQEEPKRVKKANPNRKTKKGPSQVDPKTILESPRGRFADFSLTPRGAFGHPKTTKNGTKNDPQKKRKSRSKKRRSKTSKDPSWSDLGRFGCAMWEPQDPKSIGKRNISCKFTFSKTTRFEEGSGSH